MNVLMLRHNLCRWMLERADRTWIVLDDSPGCRALPDDVLSRFARVYRVSSYDSLEELSGVAADLLARGERIDRVATFTEFTQYAAGYLANLLGLDYFSPRIAAYTRDKRLMKSLARQAGIAVPRFVSLPDRGLGADVDAIGAEVGYPLVLKPANGWGTASTTKVDSPAELAAALRDYHFEPELKARDLIAEEFISGEEFHVEGVWRDGRPWVFYVSRYFEPRLVAWLGGGLNGSTLLAEEDHTELYDRIRDVNVRFNAALGLTRGTTHLELFAEHGTGRLVFSEIASRMSGSNIGDVVEAKCGVHLGLLSMHELLDGDLADLDLTDGKFRYLGYVHVGPSRSGTITRLPTREEYLAHPNIVTVNTFLRVGDHVDVAHPSVWCTLAVIGADTEADLERAAEDVVARYEVTTT